MNSLADVRDVEQIPSIVTGLKNFDNLIGDACNEKKHQLDELIDETRMEEQTSSGLLNTAKEIEETAHVVFLAAEAAVAEAGAECAACAGSPAEFAALAHLAEATEKMEKAKEAYEIAVRHREAMEHRYELAVQCLNKSQELFDRTQIILDGRKSEIDGITQQGIARLETAYNDLTNYITEVAPDAIATYEEWDEWKPEEKEPVKPPVIISRLNPGHDAMLVLLGVLCASDSNFRETIANYRREASDSSLKDNVEIKIKRNMVGRLAEEIVMRGFAPFGEVAVTQERTYFEDGRYTKTDLIVRDLKVPVILGRGDGMSAPEHGSIAIEVKAGQYAYILSQKEHLQFQAKGHENSDTACVICTRDVRNIPSEPQEDLRTTMNEAGSRILGMLPTKDELDSVCIEYVFGNEG